jgi:hypothetical protein
MYEFIKVNDFKTDEGQFSDYALASDVKKFKMFTVLKSVNGYTIRNAYVPDKYTRNGIATDFYTMINRESIQKTGKPLRSMRPRKVLGRTVTILSWEAEKMWDNFVLKGLAKKIGDKDYIFLENKMENILNKRLLSREKFINETKTINKDSLILIHYWYNLNPTVVKVIGLNGNKIIVSHNNEYSKIKNAPNEEIVYSDIIKIMFTYL